MEKIFLMPQPNKLSENWAEWMFAEHPLCPIKESFNPFLLEQEVRYVIANKAYAPISIQAPTKAPLNPIGSFP